MKRPLITIIILILFISCISKNSKDNVIPTNAKPVDTPSFSDIIITPFSDTSYKLTLHVFDTASHDEQKDNSTVTFSYVQDDKFKKIFEDSFYCMFQSIERHDFNNDKIDDILVFYYTGARSNPTYHLYLVDTVNHKLNYVKGFEDLPNPDLDSVNNIITSLALYGGKESVSFYRINSDTLINLGHSFEADFGDDKKWNKAVKQIIKERK